MKRQARKVIPPFKQNKSNSNLPKRASHSIQPTESNSSHHTATKNLHSIIEQLHSLFNNKTRSNSIQQQQTTTRKGKKKEKRRGSIRAQQRRKNDDGVIHHRREKRIETKGRKRQKNNRKDKRDSREKTQRQPKTVSSDRVYQSG